MEYKVYVGTLLEIKKGFMQGKFKIMYCGMPNEKSFVLAPFVAKGYQGFSPNIFFDLSATEVQVFDVKLHVVEVTSEYIILADI